MVEVITKIRTAEENAEELRRLCRRTVSQIRDESVLRGKRLLEDEAQRAANDSAGILREAEADVKIRLESSRAEAEKLCGELRLSAGGRMDSAAKFIVERIVAGL